MLRIGKLLFVAAALALVGNAPGRAQESVLNLQEAEIKAFIDDVARLTGRTFIVDPRVQGRVTISSQIPLTPDQIFDVFLATLSVHGFAAAPTPSGAYKIIVDEVVAQEPGAADGGPGGGWVTEAFRLRRSDPRQVSSMIRPLVHRRGHVAVSPESNVLVVVDAAANIDRIRKIIEEVDQRDAITRTVSLENASATAVAQTIDDLARADGGEAAGLFYDVAPLPSSNSLILRGDRARVDQMEALALEIDALGAAEDDISVHYLKHANAEEVAEVLNTIASNAVDAVVQAGPPAIPRSVSITAYPPTNSIILSGDPGLLRSLSRVVGELDVRRAQVLVEAIIVEISEGAARDLGLQFLFSGDGQSAVPFGATNFSRSSPNLLATTGAALLRGDAFSESSQELLESLAVSSLLGIQGLALGGAGQLDNGLIFSAILTAVDQDARSNLLSTPSVMTLDNEPSSILVGQEIPITTGESLGANNVNPFRQIQRQEVGVKLEVTPQINDGDTVRLTIRQEVSSIFGPVSATFSELITDKREIETTVLADDGEIIVLGGLIDDDERVAVDKVPLLGDIPGLGRVFQARSRTRDKTNLMVFIRPTIIRSEADARAATSRKYDYMRMQQLLRAPGEATALDRLLEGAVGAAPPTSQQTSPDTEH
ncbi:MAG: type II secretion system secretin GspD [Parvularculaceae bacterium]